MKTSSDPSGELRAGDVKILKVEKTSNEKETTGMTKLN